MGEAGKLACCRAGKKEERESLEAQLRGKQEPEEGTESKANVQIASLGQRGILLPGI